MSLACLNTKTIWRRPLTSHDHGVQPVDFIGYDVTGGEIEYQILESMGPNTTHLKVSSTISENLLCALLCPSCFMFYCFTMHLFYPNASASVPATLI